MFHSNYGHILHYFQDTATYWRKNMHFYTPPVPSLSVTLWEIHNVVQIL